MAKKATKTNKDKTAKVAVKSAPKNPCPIGQYWDSTTQSCQPNIG